MYETKAAYFLMLTLVFAVHSFFAFCSPLKILLSSRKGKRMAGGFSARLFFPLDREGKLSFTLRSNYRFSSLRKISVKDRYFLCEGKSRCHSDIFSLKGRKKRPIFSLPLKGYFSPARPSSIQYPPCSFSLLLTVFSLTPIY